MFQVGGTLEAKRRAVQRTAANSPEQPQQSQVFIARHFLPDQTQVKPSAGHLTPARCSDPCQQMLVLVLSVIKGGFAPPSGCALSARSIFHVRDSEVTLRFLLLWFHRRCCVDAPTCGSLRVSVRLCACKTCFTSLFASPNSGRLRPFGTFFIKFSTSILVDCKQSRSHYVSLCYL